MKTTKLFLLALVAAMTACQEYVPVDTYAEPEDPVAMTEEQVADIRSRFTICATLEEALKDVDLVIETIVEVEEIKKSFFEQVGKLVREDTLLAICANLVCFRFL